jgi:hypothetical protein
MPMSSGFQVWKNYQPTADATLTKKIRDAGGIVIAKASLSEFARGGGDYINSVFGGFARDLYDTAVATAVRRARAIMEGLRQEIGMVRVASRDARLRHGKQGPRRPWANPVLHIAA